MLIPRLVITMQRHTDGKDKRRLQTGPSCSDATWKLQLAAGVAVATRPNFSLPLEMQSFMPLFPLSLCFLLDMIIMSAESSQDYADRVARGKGTQDSIYVWQHLVFNSCCFFLFVCLFFLVSLPGAIPLNGEPGTVSRVGQQASEKWPVSKLWSEPKNQQAQATICCRCSWRRDQGSPIADDRVFFCLPISHCLTPE